MSGGEPETIAPDLCVVGAGSGGLALAAGAAQMGARVVLVERGLMGGDCLNFGCVPSKALLAAGHKARSAGEAGLGITPAGAPEIDFAGAKDHVAATIAAIAPHDSQERFEGLGVRVIRAEARFTSPREMAAGDHRIRARRFVIATGSRPAIPPIPGLADVPHLTNETIFDLRERPGHLVVLGAGPIGLEMAEAHRALGCEVTVIEAARALAREDAEAAALILDRLRADGVRILEDTPAARVAGQAGEVTVETADGARHTGTHLLVATGRRPSLDSLDLDAAGVRHDRAGVTVGADLRSSNRRVFAIGDAAGGAQFTHLAGYHAATVIRPLLFGLPGRVRADHIPRVTYTDPELAHVGLTEAEARGRHGDQLSVARAAYEGNDRAQATCRTEGLAKVMVVRGRPVGATIAGPEAGELIGLWALAIAARLKMSAVAGMVAPYPTLGEINKRLAGAYFSARLFDNPRLTGIVRLVQRLVP